MSPEEESRRLRALERGLLITEASWVRDVFGETALPLRRTWPVLCLTVDAVAVGLLIAGVVAVLPLAFLGCVLANVGVCMHLERGSRRSAQCRGGHGSPTDRSTPAGHDRVMD
jgi:hypothetical protein